jgi:uncharacterized membrane protein
VLYLFVKFLHVIGAAVLLGTGAGIAFFMLVAHLRGDAREIAGVAGTVVIADFLFTATAVVIQPVTGVWLAWSTDYSLLEGWIMLSILLYIVTGAFWLPVIWMQIPCVIMQLPRLQPERPCRGGISDFRLLPPCLGSFGS